MLAGVGNLSPLDSDHLEMVVPRPVILSLMAVPRAVKAATTAIATKAAATAYSDNSSPVSSKRNLFTFVNLHLLRINSDFKVIRLSQQTFKWALARFT